MTKLKTIIDDETDYQHDMAYKTIRWATRYRPLTVLEISAYSDISRSAVDKMMQVILEKLQIAKQLGEFISGQEYDDLLIRLRGKPISRYRQVLSIARRNHGQSS